MQLTIDDIIQQNFVWCLMKNDRLICKFIKEETANKWLSKQDKNGYFSDAHIEKKEAHYENNA